MATVNDIYAFLNDLAPVRYQMDFDNAGFLVGDGSATVERVLLALDITDEVIAEAAELHAQLIVSHHPLIFTPLRRATADDLTGRKVLALARNGIAAVCMHTNLDIADGGVNDALAEALTTTAEWLVPDAVARWYGGSEDAFRAAVCAQAKKYRGTEYRWGGKSGRGIDCSGLVSSAYMQCGVLIYRDAKIVEGWPMHEVAFEDKKPGDALFFPGHVALYLGEGRYIHSTGAAASGGVVINSLEPEDPLYRDDLVKSLYAVGSVF